MDKGLKRPAKFFLEVVLYGKSQTWIRNTQVLNHVIHI